MNPTPARVRERSQRPRLRSRAERRVTMVLKVLAAVALAIYLLVGLLNFFGAIRTTGLLIVASVFLAYLVYPLVRRLNERLPLAVAILIVYVFIGVLVAAAVLLIAPALSSDVQNFARALPDLVARLQRETLDPSFPLLRRIPLAQRETLASLPSQLGTLVQNYGLNALERGLPYVLSAVSLVFTLIIVPVLAAYMLLEARDVRGHLLGLFPARSRGRTERIIDDLDKVIGGFIRGQLIDGAIVGVMIVVMLSIMHVPYALLIGVAAGFLNFIPYAGAVIGFIPSVLLAFAYNGVSNALIVAVLFAVIQQIDGNFVAPRVLKDNVGLSPLYIILAILIGSELFGLIGTFLAVPVAAMLRVLREHLLPAPVRQAPAPELP